MADYEDTKVTDLIINNMSQEKFDELKSAGELDPTQIYLTPTEESGGESLPDQTGNAGKFLQTNGTDVSWVEALVSTGSGYEALSVKGTASGIQATSFGVRASSQGWGVAIGGAALAGETAVAIGRNAKSTGRYGLAIGYDAQATAEYAIQIGKSYTNSDANTFKVGNANGNFEIMSADGTIPTDRYTTTPTGAGTYVPKLTITEDGTVTREWGAESGGAGGDYLPLSGGTLTGALKTQRVVVQEGHELVFPSERGTNPTFGISMSYTGVAGFGVGNFGGGTNTLLTTVEGHYYPNTDGTHDFGKDNAKWRTLYVVKLNNGADIAIPTEGGTLARLEDLEGLGGASLPDQTDNAGKFLMTNGSEVSWGNALVNESTQNAGLKIRALGFANQPVTCLDVYAYNVSIGHNIVNEDGVAIGEETQASESVSIGYGASSQYKGVAIGEDTNAGAFGIALGGGAVAGDTEFVVGLGGDPIKIIDHTGLFPRERMSALVEVLPTAENGYTTVKNYGNGYVEITGYTAIGTVGASTGSEVQIDLPTGYTMANANYWVNIAPTSETTMFDFKAEAKARSTTHFMVAYKNEDTTTGLTAAGVYWEVRGMLATE